MPVPLMLGGVAVVVAYANRGGSDVKVLNRYRATGVDQRLQWLLDEWERYGTHVVTVAGGIYSGIDYVGGLRTVDEQYALYNVGLSAAEDADDSPHVRGGALDVWPAGFVPNRSFAEQLRPDYADMMRVFGEFAEARGFKWGGRWPKPDMPHVELSDWRTLPLPGV